MPKTTDATKTRTRKPLSEDAQKLMDAAKKQLDEARALGKVVDLINGLNEWALDQLGAAIERRRENLKTPESVQF